MEALRASLEKTESARAQVNRLGPRARDRAAARRPARPARKAEQAQRLGAQSANRGKVWCLPTVCGTSSAYLQLSPAVTRSLIRAGFVNPEPWSAALEFLLLLPGSDRCCAPRALMQAKISAKRIRRSLESLRRELPEALPLSGLAIGALGDRVVVRDGDARWQVDGRYAVRARPGRHPLQDGVLHVVEHREEPARPEAVSQDWFSQGLALENSDPDAALNAYRQAVAAEPDHAPAWTNWGRLLHEGQGCTREAADVYQRARQSAGHDSLLLFNHGVLLEDLGDAAAALQAYPGALSRRIRSSPTAHYRNLLRRPVRIDGQAAARDSSPRPVPSAGEQRDALSAGPK